MTILYFENCLGVPPGPKNYYA